jgi:tetratricopeptide (TPR) repeat protein
VLLAVGLAILAPAVTARADWEVRRTNDHALVEQAERALVARPEDGGLATRLVHLAGKRGASALRTRFEARAGQATASYEDVAASATLLFALAAYDDAAMAYARAAALRPTFAMFVGRARSLERIGRREDALAAYDDALARTTSASERKRLLELEVTLVPPTDLERELRIRRALATLAPGSEDAANGVVDVLERLGRPAEAADVLEARGPGRERWFERGLRVAELRDAAGASARAAQILGDLLERLPRSDGERRRLAWTRALAVARRGDTLAPLATALARDAGPVEWDILSQVRDELGDLEGALEAARRAAGSHPSPTLGRRIVALLDRLGREDEAVAVYEQLARQEPDDPTFALELIERELRRGRHQQGGAHFDQAMTHFGGSPSAMVRLAELAARWGEGARARTAWERVRHLAPRDEQGILGLGETLFAADKRELALRTWRALREHEPSGVQGHLRFAEVLLEHDLLAEAFAEAQEARDRAPKQPRIHRLLAQVLERQRQTDAALREWDATLALATGDGRVAERREARTRILALLARSSRARLDERVRALEERVRMEPDDRETALFLAEAQQRLGNQAGAIATLRAILDRASARRSTSASLGARSVGGGEANAELTLALVRQLRAVGLTEEAVRRLEELAACEPARAREAHVQIADIELARHDERVALDHAEQAARLGPGDGPALARIAAIQERAGDDGRAFETYRHAFESDADATAGFALAVLDERRGDVAASTEVLRRIVETATDDEVIFEAGRRAIDAEELLGRLPDFERLVARGLFSGARAPAMRRVFVEVLRRLLPAVYRAGPENATARSTRERLAQHGLRPLLELVTDIDGPPDRTIVELLGMLGNKDAAPVLARLAAPATDATTSGVDHGARTTGADEARIAAVIALGRLADERGHDVLATLATAPAGPLRAAAVWALGRLGSARDAPLFSHALRDARADVVGFACLGLGRARDARPSTALAGIATDVARPVTVRRAAIAGLGFVAERAAIETLLGLARAGDDTLTRAALLALGERRDRRALPALLDDALLARAPVRGAALLALDLWASGAVQPDEARAIEGTRLDLETTLTGLEPGPSGADASVLWRDDARMIGGVLVEALRDPGERRRRALEALDGGDHGPGLGGLVAEGATPLEPATVAALAAIAAFTRDAVAARLDDAEPDVRARALVVLAKAGDPRVTPRLVARSAAGRSEERDAAVAVARRWAATAPSVARALSDALTAALLAARAPSAPGDRSAETSAEASAPGSTDGTWASRLGLVETLAATGSSGAVGLGHALDDANVLVRAAAASGLAATRARGGRP